MKRWIFLATIGLFGSYIAFHQLKIEQDVIQSVEASRPAEAQLMHALQKSGLFQDHVHVRRDSDSPLSQVELDAALAQANYEPLQTSLALSKDPQLLLPLALMMDEQHWQKWLSPAHRSKIVEQLRQQLALPGSGSILRWLEADPLMITQGLAQEFAPGAAVSTKHEAGLHIYQRKGSIDFDKLETLYTFLKKNDQSLSFISGDFFALENYLAVQQDIMVCSILSVIINIFVFRWLCRSWKLLGFLLLGTWLSYVAGILAARLFYPAVSGLVLAFSSTFVSFNNESLVHLSGLKRENMSLSIIGLGSAIGTTLIGFVVLLVSDSVIARQMGLVSIAGMLAFLAFVLLFQDKLKSIEFRPLSWPKLYLSRIGIYRLFALFLVLFCLVPWPRLATNLLEFRYASDYLLKQTEHFSQGTSAWPLVDLVAKPVTLSIEDEWQQIKSKHWLAPSSFQPLNLLQDREFQERRLVKLQASLPLAVQALQKDLNAEGIALHLDGDKLLAALKPVSAEQWLELWNKMTPLNWSPKFQDKTWLVFFASSLAREQNVTQLVSLHPKIFYEELLTDLTQNLGRMFLLGLLVMFVYLIPWQRSLDRVFYIFTPLLLSALALAIYFYLSHRSINIVHMMGFALVIAVALDYSSIMSAVGHYDTEQSKVLLTGFMTLASFAILILAKHPVLHDLGVTVSLGTGVSLLFSLLVRIRHEA